MSPGTFQPGVWKGQWCLLSLAHQLLMSPLQWTIQPQCWQKHCIKPQDRATQQETASLIITTTIITTGVPTECSLAILSTRPGQQDEHSAKDRHWIDELSQQPSDTTTQLTHISKVLDHLLTSHMPTATLADVQTTPSTSAGNGAVPSGPTSSLLQQGTASSEIHSTESDFHINGQAAPHSHAEVWQDQAGPAQTQAYNSTLSHSVRPFFPSDFLAQIPVSLGAPTQGQHLTPESATTPTGYNHHRTVRDPTAQHLGWPLYSNIRTGLVTLPAMGPLLGISQTTTNVTSMATDIDTMG